MTQPGARGGVRFRQVAASGAAAAALLPSSVLLASWVASAGGVVRTLSLVATCGALWGLHMLVHRVARRELTHREFTLVALLGGGLLASFAIAVVLTAWSLNADLYALSRGDVVLAGVVVSAPGCVLLGHATASGRAARRAPRIRRSGDFGP